MRWEWLPKYFPSLIYGFGVTMQILIISVVVGFLLAIPIGLAQVNGSRLSKSIAGGFCSYIRGTPLLTQIWLLYYGIGSLFPLIPGMRENFMWLIRLDAYWYVLLAFTLSFAGYEAEIMRGAFLSVPKGELEAARAFGMNPGKVLRRVWLPSAILKVLPTLAGEVIGQLKSTPLAFTVPVMDMMSVTSKIRQDTYLTYEPLLFLAAIYLTLTFFITRLFAYFESYIPVRR
jgi:polar amino acid transport system permease protein